MYLPRASDGFVDNAQAAQRGTRIETRLTKILAIVLRRGTEYREVVEEEVLGDIIDGDVEAGRVGQVKHVQGVLERQTLLQLGGLDDRNVGASLPSLAEDVALSGGEVGFIEVAWRNRATQITRAQEWQGEASRIEGGEARGCATYARESLRWRAATQWNDGVGDSVGGAIEDAAHGARKIDDAVGLAALENPHALNGPAIAQFGLKRRLLEKVGHLQ